VGLGKNRGGLVAMLGFGRICLLGSYTGPGTYLFRFDVSGKRVGVVSLVVCHVEAERQEFREEGLSEISRAFLKEISSSVRWTMTCWNADFQPQGCSLGSSWSLLS